MKWLVKAVLLSVVAINAQAQIDQPKEITTSQTFGDYTVFYNVFHSTDVPAKIAEAHKLVRGRDRALLNISLVKNENGKTSLGLPVSVAGNTRNLMQQQQPLKFIEITEGDATYYLAPFVFNNEEVLHFTVQLTPQDAKPMNITFNRTLYTE